MCPTYARTAIPRSVSPTVIPSSRRSLSFPLPVFDDDVAPLVEGLVELVEGNAVFKSVEGSLVGRAVEGDDPVGQPPLQNAQIPTDVAEPEDELDRGRHDDDGVLRPRTEGQSNAPRLLGLVVGPVEVYLDHPVADRDTLAAQPIAGSFQRADRDSSGGPARNVGVGGELHHAGGQETLEL